MNQRIKILCVDDESDLLDIMKDALSELGHEILIAKDVNQALTMIENNSMRLAIVISDYLMGDLTGFDLRKQMMQAHKQIPFLLVSGNITKEFALEAIDLKISGFIAKPFNNDELLKIVDAQIKDRVAAILEDDELRAGFVQDAQSLIDEMEGLILHLEEDPDNSDTINRIFACAHTIKGASGFFKPNTIHHFMHKYEDFLSPFRKGDRRFDLSAGQVLLNGLDKLKSLTASLAEQKEHEESLETLVSIFSEKVEAATIEKTEDSSPTQPHLASAKANAPTKTQADELRISIRVLNEFMEKSGEITVLRNMVNKVLNLIESSHEDDPNVATLSELMGEMHRSISVMQDQIEDLKKVSLSQLVRPLNRSLRDLCINLKKHIQLNVTGDNIRVDHFLSETLGKCLIHLLRNSADHGIEMPEKRIELGKPEAGTIRLSFHETPDEITVQLSDDGKGINTEQIKKKVIEKGLLTLEQANEKSDSEIQMMIFEPGFSTSEQITDVSGRGVGTDMVKQVVTNAGGRIELKSKLGQGTEFTLRLPVPKSVLIINSLLIRTKNETYSIPQDSVDRIIAIDSQTKSDVLKKVGDRYFYLCDHHLDPIVNLSEVFSLPTEAGMDGFLVRVRCQDYFYCIYIDEVLGSEDIVVKSMPSWFRSLNIYKGVTFLGDGKIGLILDIDRISESISATQPEIKHSEHSIEAASKAKDQFLFFTTGGQSLYAIPQSDIYRIEQIPLGLMQKSGSRDFVVYRERPMPLIDLKNLFPSRLNSNNEQHQNEALNVVVLKKKDGFAGYIVDTIEDLITCDPIANAEFYSGDLPVHVINERTVTVLNAEILNGRAFSTESKILKIA